MAASTGYPCGNCAEGVTKSGFQTEATCIMSCKNDCASLCVEPETTKLASWSFVAPNAEGVAEQVTFDNVKDLTSIFHKIYFTICPVCPKEEGRRYFSDQMKVNGNCINWEAMGADTPEKIAELSMYAQTMGQIHIYWPSMN